MGGLKKQIKSPHIIIALATGVSIIIMAYVSKRFLSETISYIQFAIPPFIATIHSVIYNRYKNSKLLKTWYWVVAILLATFIIIVFHLK